MPKICSLSMKRRWIRHRLAANCAHSSTSGCASTSIFCSKYGHSPGSNSSLPLFVAKPASKNQPEAKRSEASVAVTLYFKMADTGKANALSKSKAESDRAGSKGAEPAGASPVTAIREAQRDHPAREDRPLTNSPDGFARDLRIREPGESMPLRRERIPVAAPIKGRGSSWLTQYEEMKGAVRNAQLFGQDPRGLPLLDREVPSFCAEQAPGSSQHGRCQTISDRSGRAPERRRRSSDQAFNALLFFYRHVLRREFGKIDGVVRAKRRPYVPVVLSRGEVDAVLERLPAPYRLVGALLYGCGLRLSECLELRIHCFNLDSGLLTVHDGKGQKDRTVPLPARLLPEIREQIEAVRRVHKEDLALDTPACSCRGNWIRIDRNAAREFIWQWFFPAATLTSLQTVPSVTLKEARSPMDLAG